MTLTLRGFSLLVFCLWASSVFAHDRKIVFEENKNQWPRQVEYMANLVNGRLFLEKNTFTYNLREYFDTHERDTSRNRIIKCHAYKVHFQNANLHAQVRADDRQDFIRNYYVGNNPAQWAEGVNVFGSVMYSDLYQGIDMHVYSRSGNLKYDLIVHPEAAVSDIELKYEGTEALRIESGNLLVKTSVGTVIEQKPYAYQLLNGAQVEIPCNYVLLNNSLRFSIGNYDTTQPLIIDPTLIVSTYTGSTSDNWGYTATYDAAGNIYTGGVAFSSGYPTTVGSHDQTYNGGVDIVLTKFNPNGTGLLFSTYYGGSLSDEQPHSLIVNSSNELFVMGRTASSNFPTTAGAYDVSQNGGYDIIVGKFNTSGGLLASTYVGGSSDDGVNYSTSLYGNLKFNYADDGRGEIMLDNSGNVYVAACTKSSNFPTVSAYDNTLGGTQDACAFKMNSTLTSLTWSTYLGGTSDDAAYGIKVDANGNTYITGGTQSSNFPVTAGVLLGSYQGGTADGFISVLNSTGSSLLRSTFIGTGSYDQSFFIELDNNNDVYITGQTQGVYPVSGGVYFNTGGKQFIHKLNNALTATSFSTVFGTNVANPNISPTAFLVDSCQNLYVSGWGRCTGFSMPSTSSTTGMPVTANAQQSTTDGCDFYFIVLTANAQSLWYATFFGRNGGTGDHVDGGTSRFDQRAVIYQSVCAGCGGSSAFPTTAGAWSNTNNSTNCNNAVIKMDVKVQPLAVPTANPPSLTGCAPFVITFSSSGSIGSGYLWNFGDGSPTTTSPNPSHTYTAAGTYTVTLTASMTMGACILTDTKTLVVTVGSPSTLSPSSTNVSCFGGNNGSATISASGGMSPYTYQWSPGGQTTSTATGLSAGTYTVVVRDNVGCSSTGTVAVTQPTAVTGTLTSTNTTCALSNGTATANGGGGTPGYSYTWNPGGQTTQTATGLAAGTYTVTIRDNNNCTATRTVAVSSTAPPSVTASSTAAGCSVANGSATANASSGTAPYTYSWSSGHTTSVATGLAGGTYTITIADATGCTATNTVFVGSTSAPSATVTSSSPAGCTVANGSATASPSGGTPAYSYQWIPGGQTTQTASNLSSGTYSVVVTDANGCTAAATVNIAVTGDPAATAAAISPAGCTVANGSATVTPTGGTPGYAYQWNPGGQTTQTASNLTAGNYSVLVTDANGCTASATVSITTASGPTAAAAAANNVSCFGGSDGSATATPSGGSPGYTYQWSNGDSNQTATGLAAGTYTVIVTDANGCSFVASASVTEPAALTNVLSSYAALCNGDSSGGAVVSPSGGTPGYTYAWSNGQTNQTATGLPAGSYTVVVSDANGCTDVQVTSVTEPSVLSVASSQSDVLCNGGNTGSASITPSGGTPGYSYQWSNGASASSVTGLFAGNYTVIVSDANGCTSTQSFVITEPAVLGASLSQTNVLCNGGNSGSASATPSGGTPGYTYSWTSGATTSTATGLAAGNYTVTVSDANGCTYTQSFVITEPAVLGASLSQTNVLCNGGSNGSASAAPAGGTPAYTYSWNNGQTTSSATGLSAGSYIVVVTDANGCSATQTVSITQPAALASSVSSVNVVCNGGSNGSATAVPSGGTPGYTYSWSNGASASSATGLAAGNYSVLITDANGCTTTQSVTIIQPPPITLSVSGIDSICLGDSAALSASASGGTPVYTYVWSPGSQSGTSVTVSPSASTTYSVVMTDANGCVSLVQTYNVTVLPSPFAGFDTLSTGIYNSVYSFTDSSTGAVTWYWNFGDGSAGSTLQNPTHTFPGAGTYTVTQVVFNQYGCPDTFITVVLVESGILIPNVFTPDGNGQNDVWYIPNSGMKEFRVEIYDRWGLKVWEAVADEIRWDGRSSAGKLLSDGTYYYVLRAVLKTPTGEKDYSTNGYVTLLTKQR